MIYRNPPDSLIRILPHPARYKLTSISDRGLRTRGNTNSRFITSLTSSVVDAQRSVTRGAGSVGGVCKRKRYPGCMTHHSQGIMRITNCNSRSPSVRGNREDHMHSHGEIRFPTRRRSRITVLESLTACCPSPCVDVFVGHAPVCSDINTDITLPSAPTVNCLGACETVECRGFDSFFHCRDEPTRSAASELARGVCCELVFSTCCKHTDHTSASTI
jgi:hypothetical protein